ncbi:Fur-regulated basic protein FbpA [Bacillus sp. PS06]|uniref:Fur-regulated basic protein FbpA n=1 Tax=Bacillus sp. PS06 TaxID=2764176 RepID=UPI00177BCB69|nr:Fur-regulated basic protein FbpA [Bacillus sp. PS06]MBD8067699.1 Fur-regulated basic protein FbpA [Bacillus sp. PS06]
MTKHLRNAVEKMRHHYIQKLIESGAYSNNEEQLYDYTLSELIEEYNKTLVKTKS